MYFLRIIARILNVNEDELAPALVAPDSMETGWYNAITISAPFTKPTEQSIVDVDLEFKDFDLSVVEISRDLSTSMLQDDSKQWANSALFLKSLVIDDVARVKIIAEKAKIIIDKNEAKQVIENGKLRYKNRISFSFEVTALMGYLNESKSLTASQFIEQAGIFAPIKEALSSASTSYALSLVVALIPDEIIITTADQEIISNEITEYLASEI